MIKTIVRQKSDLVTLVSEATLLFTRGEGYVCYKNNSYTAILTRLQANKYGFAILGKPIDPKFVAKTPQDAIEYALDNRASKRILVCINNLCDIDNIPLSKPED